MNSWTHCARWQRWRTVRLRFSSWVLFSVLHNLCRGYMYNNIISMLFQPLLTSVSEIIILQREETCFKLFQNYFRGIIAAHKYFPKHVQCRWNNFWNNCCYSTELVESQRWQIPNNWSVVREIIGVDFYKAPRLEPPFFKVQGYPAFEPPLFVRCNFCQLWSCYSLPQCNKQ